MCYRYKRHLPSRCSYGICSSFRSLFLFFEKSGLHPLEWGEKDFPDLLMSFVCAMICVQSDGLVFEKHCLELGSLFLPVQKKKEQNALWFHD